MRDACELNVDLLSDRIKVLATPSDVLACRHRFPTIAAHTADVLVIVGYVVEGLVASHLDRSKDSFFFLLEIVCDATDVVVDFERHPASFLASSSVPFTSVPASPGCFQDEWLQILVRYLHDAHWLFFPLPALEFITYLHAMPHYRFYQKANWSNWFDVSTTIYIIVIRRRMWLLIGIGLSVPVWIVAGAPLQLWPLSPSLVLGGISV